MTTSPESPLTPSDVAELFNVSVQTVGLWADSGKLRSFRTPGGHRRFRRGDVEKFIADQESVA